MHPIRQLPDLPLDPPCDTAFHRRESWIEQSQQEIIDELRERGRWYSYARDQTWYPADAVDEAFHNAELLFNASVAAFWCAPVGADHGEMKLKAADDLKLLMEGGIVRMARDLAEREYEIAHGIDA